MSLLDSKYISKEAVDSCETEVQEATGMLKCTERPEATEKVIWNNYRQQLMDVFTKRSQNTPIIDCNDDAGKL